MSGDRFGFGWALMGSLSDYRLDLLGDVLSAQAEGIRKCDERIVRASADGPQEYVDAVTDNACELIELLLGNVFTACQAFIARVVADVRSLHALAARPSGGNAGVLLTTTTTGKRDLMRYGSDAVNASGATQIELINALANYYKHRDEWRGDWNALNGLAAETVRVISAVGLKRGSTGNLRTGAEALGNPEYINMGVFIGILKGWRDRIMADYEQELRDKKLITYSSGEDLE